MIVSSSDIPQIGEMTKVGCKTLPIVTLSQGRSTLIQVGFDAVNSFSRRCSINHVQTYTNKGRITLVSYAQLLPTSSIAL